MKGPDIRSGYQLSSTHSPAYPPSFSLYGADRRSSPRMAVGLNRPSNGLKFIDDDTHSESSSSTSSSEWPYSVRGDLAPQRVEAPVHLGTRELSVPPHTPPYAPPQSSSSHNVPDPPFLSARHHVSIPPRQCNSCANNTDTPPTSHHTSRSSPAWSAPSAKSPPEAWTPSSIKQLVSIIHTASPVASGLAHSGPLSPPAPATRPPRWSDHGAASDTSSHPPRPLETVQAPNVARGVTDESLRGLAMPRHHQSHPTGSPTVATAVGPISGWPVASQVGYGSRHAVPVGLSALSLPEHRPHSARAPPRLSPAALGLAPASLGLSSAPRGGPGASSLDGTSTPPDRQSDSCLSTLTAPCRTLGDLVVSPIVTERDIYAPLGRNSDMLVTWRPGPCGDANAVSAGPYVTRHNVVIGPMCPYEASALVTAPTPPSGLGVRGPTAMTIGVAASLRDGAHNHAVDPARTPGHPREGLGLGALRGALPVVAPSAPDAAISPPSLENTRAAVSRWAGREPPVNRALDDFRADATVHRSLFPQVDASDPLLPTSPVRSSDVHTFPISWPPR